MLLALRAFSGAFRRRGAGTLPAEGGRPARRAAGSARARREQGARHVGHGGGRVRDEVGTNSRNPRHVNIIEGGRVYQALHIDSERVLGSKIDALCRVKKCVGRSTVCRVKKCVTHSI